jgi:hypothetical protein
MRKRNLIFSTFVTVLFLLSHHGSGFGAEWPAVYGQERPIQPPVMVWAWERPEDLGFIDSHQIGVAFLACTIHIRGETALSRPRLQPLFIPQDTYLIAVVRIDVSRKEPPQLTPILRQEIVSIITELATHKGISAVQIDYDAKTSERSFYKELICDVRKQIPKTMPLSITALATWCIHDYWISGLPIDEAVPMLFRMGPEKGWVSLYLEDERDFKPLCRESLGISTDEPLLKLPSGRRLYIFHPKAWSEEALKKIINEVKK